MNFRTVSEPRKMYRSSCIILLLLLGSTHGIFLYQNDCFKICNGNQYDCFESAMRKYGQAEIDGSCSIDDIIDSAVFTDIKFKGESQSFGLVKTTFTLPDVRCCYNVALLENSLISNSADCTNSVFHESNAYDNETHSPQRTICPLAGLNETSIQNCQNKELSMVYQYLFPGCYALRFSGDGDESVVLGSTYHDTNFTRTEVAPPLFYCHYEDQIDSVNSKELVTFVFRISVHTSINYVDVKVTSTPRYLDKNDENSSLYAEIPIRRTIDTHNLSPLNCSVESASGNEPDKMNIYCNWVLLVPRNASYGYEIDIPDVRCNRQSLWNPPVDKSDGVHIPCNWKYSCTAIPKNSSAIVYSDDGNEINTDHIFLLPIAVAVILVVLIVVGSIFVYRSHSRYTRPGDYLTTNLRDPAASRYRSEKLTIETTDEETLKQNNNANQQDAIILLYARGSPSFMSLMSDFRDVLRNNCRCHVRDWYAASEWDAVARVGPSAWVANLLRQNHRAVWIDTPRARSLIDTQWRNNRLNEIKRTYERCFDEEAISDFRDIALPSVLDLAKRNVTPEPALQYTKHFVVRLEGFDATANKSEDPFEDLSPHTRYLIPYHLTELCSHISSWRTNVNIQRIKTEEAQLRERLIRMKTNNS